MKINANLRKRLFSAIILIALLLVSIKFRPLFVALLIAVAALMLLEWFEMTKSSMVYCSAGLVIIPVPITAILFISQLDSTGQILLFFALIITIVDTAAMFGGKTLKGPLLAPQISPKKTVSGLIAAIFAAAFLPVILNFVPGFDLFDRFSYKYNIFQISLMSGTLAIISQLSDLFVSLFKRRFNIKDTGSIIPGHGGILDRFDSYILTAPIMLIFLLSS